jgi:enoyl-CoA hydratase/carnithine racemase
MGDITLERHDGVGLLRIQRSVPNALSLELVRELAGCLEEAMGDPETRALVMGSGNDKFFCIGFDIPQLMQFTREEMATFYREFNNLSLRLYTLPKATVAALSGHAIAGGCILALCCDYRMLAEGRKLMGLNEVKLGVPVPYLADCIVRSLLGDGAAREVLEGGEFYPPEQLLRMGMVDRTLPLDEVQAQAQKKAVDLAALPSQAYTVIKRNRTEEIEARFIRRREEKQEHFLDCWYSPDTQARLKEAASKF